MWTRRFLRYAVTLLLALAGCELLANCAQAQSLCDLLPATVMKSALGLTGDLSAKPNTEGGNGCDYKSAAVGPTTVIADSSDDAGHHQDDLRSAYEDAGARRTGDLGEWAMLPTTKKRRTSRSRSFQGRISLSRALYFEPRGRLFPSS
jgi:hypothetical protein